jgi:predicted RNase H-like HicB family nuclease
METYRFSVVVEQNERGYHAHCPEFDGCSGHGDTYEKAIEDVKVNIVARLEEKLRTGEEIPQPFTPCTVAWAIKYSLN